MSSHLRKRVRGSVCLTVGASVFPSHFYHFRQKHEASRNHDPIISGSPSVLILSVFMSGRPIRGRILSAVVE